jgi:hypothetical protein
VEIRPNFASQTAPALDSTLLLAREPANVDPARDGLVGLYALRILDRGIDPRVLVAEHRSIRYGVYERAARRLAADTEPPPVIAVGRSAVAHEVVASPPMTAELSVSASVPTKGQAPVRVRRLSLPSAAGLASLLPGPALPAGGPRRLVAAGLAAAVMLGAGLLGALAQDQASSPTYTVEAETSGLTER